MHLNKRYAPLLVFVCSLLLAGSDRFRCTDEEPEPDDDSSNSRISVVDEQQISANSGGFNGTLGNRDRFGSAVTDLGDLESDGVRDLAVGAPFNNGDGNNKGAVWILFMDDNGQVDQEQKISSTAGSFGSNLDDDDLFGSAVAAIGDLNGDGDLDLAVGAPGNDNAGPDRGGVWILFLDSGGKVRQKQKIADGAGDFAGSLDDEDRFGSAIAEIGDVNGDGITDLAVGAPNDDDGADNAGAVWILFMRMDGTVEAWQKISRGTGEFDGNLEADDNFGAAVAGTGDLDQDGIPDLVVGAPGGDASGAERGEVWVLFLDNEGKVRQEEKIADGTGGFNGDLDNDDRFGSAIAAIGDVNDDGITDLVVGAPNDDDGADNAGAIWILLMKTDGRVAGWQKVSASAGGFNGNLNANDHFGAAVTGIGNLDSRGIADLAVGAPGDDAGGQNRGALWVLFMERRL
ncbi:MAG: integrin alpha [Pseudomonadota bacterium]